MTAAASPLTFTIPRIATPRLLLREARVGDFEAYAENLADPEATKFMPSAPDRRAAWRSFSAEAGSWVLHGKGWWFLELRESGEPIGNVGAFIRETATDLELGWSIFRRFWGHGYATEAARAALEFSFEGHSAKRAIAHISADNTASLGVSRKLGMKYESDVDLYGAPIGRYAIDR